MSHIKIKLSVGGFVLLLLFLFFSVLLHKQNVGFQLRGISVGYKVTTVACSRAGSLDRASMMLNQGLLAFNWQIRSAQCSITGFLLIVSERLSVAVKTQRPCRRSCFCVIWVTLACCPWQRHRLSDLSLSLFLFSADKKGCSYTGQINFLFLLIYLACLGKSFTSLGQDADSTSYSSE